METEFLLPQGSAPSRWTLFFSPRRGFHYLVSQGNVVADSIYLDNNSPVPFLFGNIILLPYIERIFTFPFVWKQLMTEQDAAKKNLIPLLTYKKEVEKSTTDNGKNDGKKMVETQSMCLVRRSRNDQWFLLDREVHPFDIKIVSSDGAEVQIVFKFVLRILDAKGIMSAYPSGNFLSYVEDLLKTEIGKKLREKELEELQGATKGGVNNDCELIVIDINQKTTFPKDLFIIDTLLPEDVILSKGSESIIKARQEKSVQKITTDVRTEIAKQTKINAEADAEAITIKGKAEITIAAEKTETVGTKEAEVLGLKLAKVIEFQKADKALVDETKVAVALQQNKVTTLVTTGTDEGNPIVKQLVANIATKGVGNGN